MTLLLHVSEYLDFAFFPSALPKKLLSLPSFVVIVVKLFFLMSSTYSLLTWRSFPLSVCCECAKGSFLSQDQQLKWQRDQKWHHRVVSLMILENRLLSVILFMSQNDASFSLLSPSLTPPWMASWIPSQDLFSSLAPGRYECEHLLILPVESREETKQNRVRYHYWPDNFLFPE